MKPPVRLAALKVTLVYFLLASLIGGCGGASEGGDSESVSDNIVSDNIVTDDVTDVDSTGSSDAIDDGSSDDGGADSNVGEGSSSGSDASDGLDSGNGPNISEPDNSDTPAPAVNYQLSGTREELSDSSILLELADDSGVSLTADMWSIPAGLVAVYPDQSSVLLTLSSDRIDIPAVQSFSITAYHEGEAVTAEISFLPTFRYTDASYPLPLSHNHQTSELVFGRYLTPYWSDPSVWFGFDNAGWVSERLQVSFPGLRTGSALNYEAPWGLLDRYDAVRGQRYLLIQHKSDDELVFMRVSDDGSAGQWVRLGFTMPGDYASDWVTMALPDFWLLARTVATLTPGNSADYRRLDIQIYKLSYDGNVLASKRLRTSDIIDLGFAQGYFGQYSNGYVSTPELRRHFDDVLISGFSSNFAITGGIGLTRLNHLWIPLTPETMAVGDAFWFRADRFKRAAYSEPPTLDLRSTNYGWDIPAGTAGAWSAHGGFSVSSGNTGYSSSNQNEGWIEAILAADYSDVELLTFGNKSLDTTAYYDYLKRWFTGTAGDLSSSDQSGGTLTKRYVGSRSLLHKLPDLSVDTSAGCSVTGAPYNGGFSYDSGDCINVPTFYLWDRDLDSLSVNRIPPALAVSSVFSPEIYGGTWSDGSERPVAGLRYREESNWAQSVTLELANDGEHPGCTTPESYSPPTLALTRGVEEASVERPDTHAYLINESVLTESGSLIISRAPYQNRAPLLCSQYRVSLDQVLVMRHSTTMLSSSTSPRLHDIYTRTLIGEPANGRYDPDTNRYYPNIDFVGEDSFIVRLDDRTGTQEVEIRVKVL